MDAAIILIADLQINYKWKQRRITKITRGAPYRSLGLTSTGSAQVGTFAT
jgi:hypothetical protein